MVDKVIQFKTSTQKIDEVLEMEKSKKKQEEEYKIEINSSCEHVWKDVNSKYRQCLVCMTIEENKK